MARCPAIIWRIRPCRGASVHSPPPAAMIYFCYEDGPFHTHFEDRAPLPGSGRARGGARRGFAFADDPPRESHANAPCPRPRHGPVRSGAVPRRMGRVAPAGRQDLPRGAQRHPEVPPRENAPRHSPPHGRRGAAWPALPGVHGLSAIHRAGRDIRRGACRANRGSHRRRGPHRGNPAGLRPEPRPGPRPALGTHRGNLRGGLLPRLAPWRRLRAGRPVGGRGGHPEALRRAWLARGRAA